MSRAARFRQPKPWSAGWTIARILRHGQVRAERKFLKHAADAQRPWRARRNSPAVAPRPRSQRARRPARRAPLSTCMSVDLPAPLWPTMPTHSPGDSRKIDAVQSANGAVGFSTPVKSTRERPHPPWSFRPATSGALICSESLLHVGLDRGDRVGLGIFVARDAALVEFSAALLKSSWVKAR